MSTKINITTVKGQYRKGEKIQLKVSGNSGFNTDRSALLLKVFHLVDEVFHMQFTFPENRMIEFSLPVEVLPPGSRGFGCSCELYNEEALIGTGYTAFDILDPEQPVIRYGFLSDFKSEDRVKSRESLDFLAEFHMTHVQFYDWTYRHHNYAGPGEVYRDIMGKEIDFSLVKDEIKGCHDRGMAALGYGAVYAAGEEYLAEHPDHALRDCDGEACNLIDKFFIMDIRRGSAWRKRLMAEYTYAVRSAGFDGIHMDTYGFPKKAFVRKKGDFVEEGEPVFLEDDFPGLIGETRETLGDNAVLIFNNVGNWPVFATGPTPQDALYIEVWEPYDSYHHIRQIILDASVYEKPVILAAYLAPFRLEPGHGGERSLYSALLLHSAIVSLGASHLLLGEDGNALTQGYYNDYSRLRDDEKESLKKYYDFQVRYLDIFLDSSLAEISETHTAGENREYFFKGARTSADGRAGTVWTIVRESRSRKVFSLINLTGQEDSFWNRGKNTPDEVEEFLIEFPLDGEVRSLWLASPEVAGGEAVPVQWHRTRNQRGPAGLITLTKIPLWSVIVVNY
ncbi:MAG: glycoside hydrolase family 66 protein [Spirochaetales bacterium]|nr:glycoside hydrolase family 66 protein [Spirochaetales bacterium]